jgi:tetratricopeptide (TPR) repeat protein
MGRGLICVVALLTLMSAAAPAHANDRDLCSGEKGTVENRIAACTRLISSGRIKGGDLADIYNYRAYEYRIKLKDYDKAIADYTQALRFNPKSTTAFKGRGDSYYEKKDFDRALADASEAVRLDPKDDEAYTYRGHAYYEKKEFSRAIDEYSLAIKINGKDALNFLNRGNAYNELKDYDRAISDYNAAMAIDPKNPDFVRARGDAYFFKDDYDRAIADYSAALRLDPKLANVWRGRGNVYAEKEDYDRALADFDEAIRLDPKDPENIGRRASVFYSKKDFVRTLTELEQALRLDPANVYAINLRGVTYYARKDYDLALADFNEALRIEPDHSIVLGNRGEVLNAKREFDRALVDLNAAIRINPKHGQAHSHRGIALLGKGDIKGALSDLNEGIKLAPKDPYVFSKRGDFYRAQGDNARALADYAAALRIDPRLNEALEGREIALGASDRTQSKPAAVSALVSTPPAAPGPQEAIAKASRISGKRVALVMGNSAYKNVPPLENPIADARTMRDILTKLGFEVVYGENLDKRAMGRHIGEFGAIVRDADAAIVYFAGHGSTFGDVPYVVPVDSRYEKLTDIPSELIQVESLVGELRRAKGVRLVILDACRDNEREVELRRQEAASRGEAKRGGAVSRGLARLQNPDGLIVVYSTQHMTTASDGAPGSNSPFTGALARHLATPGVDIKDVLFRAGQEVIKTTGGTQRPEISISLYEPFVLAQ